jgi:sulfofructose kinase
MAEVIGIGSAVYDILMLIDRFPKEDTKMQCSATRIQSGGPCATGLGAISKLGLDVEYMGTIANDSPGISMLDDFRRYQIGTEHVRVIDGCESFHAVVLINSENSTRTCVWNKGSVPEPTEADINLTALRAARYLYLDGHHHDAALFAAKKAKEYGVRIVLDAGGLYPGIQDLVALADILIPSEEFALKFSGKAAAEEAGQEIYNRCRPEILAITQGKRGGLLFGRGEVQRYPAFEVEVIDTNGAGDVFHGAFLVGHAHHMTPIDCARFASAVSAIKCTHFGSIASVPSFNQACEFLKDRGVTIDARN